MAFLVLTGLICTKTFIFSSWNLLNKAPNIEIVSCMGSCLCINDIVTDMLNLLHGLQSLHWDQLLRCTSTLHHRLGQWGEKLWCPHNHKHHQCIEWPIWPTFVSEQRNDWNSLNFCQKQHRIFAIPARMAKFPSPTCWDSCGLLWFQVGSANAVNPFVRVCKRLLVTSLVHRYAATRRGGKTIPNSFRMS